MAFSFNILFFLPQRWINLGNRFRATAATGMNDRSSRSHSVFTIMLTQTCVRSGGRRGGRKEGREGGRGGGREGEGGGREGGHLRSRRLGEGRLICISLSYFINVASTTKHLISS